MKYCSIVIVLVVMAALIAGCAEDGERGPAGPAGNANVMMYDFPQQTSSGGTMTFVVDIDRETVDNSMVEIYYNPVPEAETTWYHAPGLGSTGAYMTRTYWFETSPGTYTFYLRFLTPDGSGTYGTDITSRRTRIFLVPASETISMAPGQSPVDVSDYEAFKAYYGIDD